MASKDYSDPYGIDFLLREAEEKMEEAYNRIHELEKEVHEYKTQMRVL